MKYCYRHKDASWSQEKLRHADDWKLKTTLEPEAGGSCHGGERGA